MQLWTAKPRHYPLILEIVEENQLPNCSMSVTSHPLATDYLQHRHSIYLQVTIIGFTNYTGQKEDKDISANYKEI